MLVEMELIRGRLQICDFTGNFDCNSSIFNTGGTTTPIAPGTTTNPGIGTRTGTGTDTRTGTGTGSNTGYISDDDISFWKQKDDSPTIDIDSMHYFVRIFVNGKFVELKVYGYMTNFYFIRHNHAPHVFRLCLLQRNVFLSFLGNVRIMMTFVEVSSRVKLGNGDIGYVNGRPNQSNDKPHEDKLNEYHDLGGSRVVKHSSNNCVLFDSASFVGI
ncbi:hypothetical protein CQW23_03440 [Capsicum baccatum]|uniref:Uncharacterized protein n=1 Tax=Capsicum baccatum TaxID=33114 RepID=A0A2G2XBS5_CAPBA|nr:hypothetical protein CQW23_03440 [Capsicum baccatum]